MVSRRLVCALQVTHPDIILPLSMGARPAA